MATVLRENRTETKVEFTTSIPGLARFMWYCQVKPRGAGTFIQDGCPSRLPQRTTELTKPTWSFSVMKSTKYFSASGSAMVSSSINQT